MRIRKTVTAVDQNEGETTEQSTDSTNAEVVTLFENKSDLTSVTLKFSDGLTKHYEALRDASEDGDDEG